MRGDSTFSFNIVGESFHQDDLWALVRDNDYDDASTDCYALLLPEPDNPYDPFAVKVVIDDVIVGHLDAARARQWSEDLFAASGIRGIAAYARIVGGFERADGTLAMLGVRLDIAFPVMAVGVLDESG